MIGYFEKIELDKMPTLKDPTQKRFYDGAAIANLKDTLSKIKTMKQLDFDHGFPPAEIEKLVNKIVSLAKKKRMTIQEIQNEIVDEFSMFDDWMQRYEYIIDLGKSVAN